MAATPTPTPTDRDACLVARSAFLDEARKIHEDAGDNSLSAEQAERFEWLTREAKRMSLAADSFNSSATVSGDGADFDLKMTGTAGGFSVGKRDDPWSAMTTARSVDLPGIARSAIEQAPHLDDAMRSALTVAVDDPETRDDNVMRWSVLTSDPDYERAFIKLASDPTTSLALMTESERAAFAKVSEFSRAMAVGTPNVGGYMVPQSLDPSILLTSDGAIDPMPRIARTVLTSTNRWEGVSSAGVTSSWDDEAEEVSDDTPTLAAPYVDCHRLTTFVPYSIEAEQDIDNLIGELQRIITDDHQVKEAVAFWTGSGTGEPRGIITSLDANTNQELATASDNTFAVADVYRLQEALAPRFRTNATFAGNIQVLNKVRRFGEGTTGSNSAFWAELGDGSPPRLIGNPIVEASPMAPFTGTGTENILLFADFSRYVIARRVGTRAEIVSHLFGSNRRPTGQRGVFMYARTGGQLLTDEAGILLQS